MIKQHTTNLHISKLHGHVAVAVAEQKDGDQVENGRRGLDQSDRVLAQRVGGAGGENHAHRHLVDDCGEDGGQDQAQPEARGGYGEGVALAFVNARDVRFAVARDRVLAPLRRALLELGPDRLVLAVVGS